MDVELHCNHLSCRKAILDKAVVTTCSHIFCVECANELFTAAQLCPACETHLREPDDVVICSLNPTNDYKTSVLSGLSPSVVLEICGRAISFWQYQLHQESAFQQAVMKSINEKNAHLQKQLNNVIREANAEMNLLQSKVDALEKELELERRRIRDIQEAGRNRDKEYQKLKNHHDKLKRRSLLAPGPISTSTEPLQHGPQAALNLTYGGSPSRLNPNVGHTGIHVVQRTPTRLFQGSLNAVEQHHAGKDAGLVGNYISGLPQQSMNHRARQSFPREEVSELSADEVEDMLYSSRRHHSLQHTVQSTGQAGTRRANQTMPIQQGKKRWFITSTNGGPNSSASRI